MSAVTMEGIVYSAARAFAQAGREAERLGRPEEARRCFEDALGALTPADDVALPASLFRWIARAHADARDPEAALDCLEAANAATVAVGAEKLLASALATRAGTLFNLGGPDEAEETFFQRPRASRELPDVDSHLAEMESGCLQIVRDWSGSIEGKDAYTQGHCSRVADYACELAVACGLPDEELNWFRMGALLHDVGKVAVPLDILNKRGPLDDDEFAVMATHPVAGVKLLEGIEFPWDIRPMIRHHHERWDGSGYPDRLAGEDIPLAARILTVADIYDALTTTRSYRAAFSHEEAMRIMDREVGHTLDPAIFSLLPACIDAVTADSAPTPLLRAM